MKKIRLGLLGKIILLTGGLTILIVTTSLTVNLLISHKNTKDNYTNTCEQVTNSINDVVRVIPDPNNGFQSIIEELISRYETVADTYEQLDPAELAKYQGDTRTSLFGSTSGMGLSFIQAARNNLYGSIITSILSVSERYTSVNSRMFVYDVLRGKIIDLVEGSVPLTGNYGVVGLAYRVTDNSELSFLSSNQASTKYADDYASYAYLKYYTEGVDESKYRCYIVTQYPLYEFNKTFNQQLTTELLITIGAAIVLVVIYAIFTKFFLIKNFRKLSKATTSFVEKMKNDEPLEVINSNIKSNDEVRDLSNEFNEMQHQIIEYVDNIKKAKAKEQQFNTEVEIASKIQLDSLPDTTYFEHNIEVRTLILPAKVVGGDFYDYFFVDKDHLAVVIADVSGKGIPASLFMMRAKEKIKAACHIERSLSEVLNKVNNSLCINNKEGYFVTVFLGVLNVKTYKFEFVNAGHERPFVKHKGKLQQLKVKSNFVLGLEEDFVYEQESIQLDKNDEIFLHTDGLNEAINEKKEEYGYQRIFDDLNNDKEIKEKIDDTIDDITKFRGKEEQFDDITILSLKIRPEILNIEIENPCYDDIEKVTNQVGEYLSESPVDVVSKIGVIIDDALNNIISYGKAKTNKKITIQVEKKKDDITLIFIDNSHPFNPLKMKNRTVQENVEEGIVGGLGISIIRNISKAIDYYYSNNKNILIIKM